MLRIRFCLLMLAIFLFILERAMKNRIISVVTALIMFVPVTMLAQESAPEELKGIALKREVAGRFLTFYLAEQTDFLEAAKNGDLASLRLLLNPASLPQEFIDLIGPSIVDQNKVLLLSAVDKYGRTALMLAAENGHVDIVEHIASDILLLEKKARLSQNGDKDESAIDASAFWLMKKQTSISLKDRKGETAIDKAKRKKRVEIVEILEFVYARQENTLDAYQQFLSQYPGSRFAHEIPPAMEQIYFERALAAKSRAALVEFLEKYPSSFYSSNARQAMEKIDFEIAKIVNSKELFVHFLETYPSGAFVSEAKTAIEKLTFESTQKQNTIAAYQGFINDFPDGQYTVQAKALLAAARSEVELEKMIQDYKDYFGAHTNVEKRRKIDEIKRGLLKKLYFTADTAIQGARGKKGFLQKAQSYLEGANWYLKIAQVQEIIGEDQKDAYTKSAYLHYRAARMHQSQGVEATAASLNSWISKPSSLEELRRDSAVAQADSHLKMIALYEKAADLFRKAGGNEIAEMMMEGGTVKHFNLENMDKELNLE